jgi:hypothetical protein
MADKKLLTRTLQENLATVIAHNDIYGKIVVNLIEPQLFEGELRIIVERCIDYWRQHSKAPKQHTQDLVADIIDDPNNRKAQTYNNILVAMLELSESINGEYVVNKLSSFHRTQRLKDAVLRSAQRLESNNELAIAEVEEIWNDILHTREIDFKPGLHLSNYERVIENLQNRQVEFISGIEQFDRRRFVPARGAVTLFLAPTGFGKSWYLIDQGARAFLQRKKIAHITLELTEDEVAQRYYQRLFSMPKRQEKEFLSTTLNVDKLGRFESAEQEIIEPDFAWEDPTISDELQTRISHVGTRFDNIIIRKFPMRSLTMNGLRAYLDHLEVVEHFIPDMLLLDYIGVTRTDPRDHTNSLGRIGEEFKGLCEERNVAGITAQQTGRISALSTTVSMTQISEAWALTNSADQVAVYSCTDEERKRGLARMYIAKARSEEDHFGVLITQNYKVGQFCIDSMLLEPKYFDFLKDMKGSGGDEDEEDDYDSNRPKR